LGSDGRVAATYAEAVQQWAYPGRIVVASEDEFPVYQGFKSEQMGGYDDVDCGGGSYQLLVPFSTMFSNRVMIHCIAAAQRKFISLYEEDFYINQPVDSDSDEQIVSRRKISLRPLEAKPLPPVPGDDVSPINDLPRLGFGRDQLVAEEALDGAMTFYQAPAKVYQISSPDQSVQLKINGALYRALLSGSVLSAGLINELLAAVNDTTLCLFIASEILDKWGDPWITFGRTLSDRTTLACLAPESRVRTSKLVSALAARFDRDVELAMRVSVTHRIAIDDRSLMSRLFSRVSPSQEAELATVWLGQTQSFVQRVALIHSLLCTSVATHEEVSVYSPTLTSWSQKDVPWGGGSSQSGHHGDVALRRRKKRLLLEERYR